MLKKSAAKRVWQVNLGTWLVLRGNGFCIVRDFECCGSHEPTSRARFEKGKIMPDKETIRRAKKDKAEGKATSTQAGEFIREELEYIRQGKHGARSTKQAIAIGLSKARRAGVKLPPPKPGQTSERTRRSAERAYEAGQEGGDIR
jgi:hypothetical protein